MAPRGGYWNGEIGVTPQPLPANKYWIPIWAALEESVKLQSHYAALLNQYDGGERKTFRNADEWILRLQETKLSEPGY